MHLLITDSGVGGLSVCAYAEQYLRRHGSTQPVRLTYVNASPENDFGYNKMGSRQEKLATFDRFLHIVRGRYAPDMIYVACNTLSVLLQDTSFFTSSQLPARGIVESGVDRLFHELQRLPESTAMIFGTPTTIDEGSYPRLLIGRGVPEARIVSQACPGLADTISEDRRGQLAKQQIASFVRQALAKLEQSVPSCLTYLACTHYGYRKELFAEAFAEAGMATGILNPNEFVAAELFPADGTASEPGSSERDRPPVPVEFVTRYRIPDTALETITFFLRDISPATVHAFQNYTHAPDLF